MPMLEPDALTSPDADARRAALLLHSMIPADREWLLGELEPAQRAELERLLQELAAMGLPADRTLLDAGLAPSEPAATPVGPHAKALAGVPAQAVVEALLNEPDRLVAQVLQCGPWGWQAELFAALSPLRRRAVQDLLRQAAPADAAPALSTALLESLRTRATELARQRRQQARSHAPAPWRRALGRWRP